MFQSLALQRGLKFSISGFPAKYSFQNVYELKKREQATHFEQTLVFVRTKHEKTAFFTYQLFISPFSDKKEKIETVWQISHP